MAFWSGEKLAKRLPSLISPYDANSIECASYELRLGEQAFVTRDDLVGNNPTAPLTEVLETTAPKNTIVIKPGQFAFLLTEEVVNVPHDALALISMKAKFKFRGLINVSGFHVDPGFSGKLVFSLYNAGPREIILTRGMKLFLIVFADLDQVSSPSYIYKGNALNQNTIKADLIEHIATGQVFSPMSLQSEMAKIREDLTETRIRAKTFDYWIVAISGILITIVTALGATLLASDTALATVGGWIKNAVDIHNKRVEEEAKSLPKILEVAPNQPEVCAKKPEETGPKESSKPGKPKI